MTLVKKPIGRIPQNFGNWDASFINHKTQLAGYGKKFRVFLYGCEFESLMENNTYAPMTLDASENFIEDTVHWKRVTGNPEVWRDGQDKPAASEQHPYNGMGRVVLKKNIVNGVNTLTQDMFYKGESGSRVPNTNTVFVIQYDFTLGDDITIPANCVLEFDGGSLSSGNIDLNNSLIIGERCFGNNVSISNILNGEAFAIWFKTNNLNNIVGSFSDVNHNVTTTNEPIQIYLRLDSSIYEVTDNLHFGNVAVVGIDKYKSIINLVSGCLYSTNHFATMIENVGITMSAENSNIYFIDIQARTDSQSISRRLSVKNVNIAFNVEPEQMASPNATYGQLGVDKVGISIDSAPYLHDVDLENIYIGNLYKGIDFRNRTNGVWNTEIRIREIHTVGCYIGIDLARIQSSYVESCTMLITSTFSEYYKTATAIRLFAAHRNNIVSLVTFADVDQQAATRVWAIAIDEGELCDENIIHGGQIEGIILSNSWCNKLNAKAHLITRGNFDERLVTNIRIDTAVKYLPYTFFASNVTVDGTACRKMSNAEMISINILDLYNDIGDFTVAFFAFVDEEAEDKLHTDLTVNILAKYDEESSYVQNYGSIHLNENKRLVVYNVEQFIDKTKTLTELIFRWQADSANVYITQEKFFIYQGNIIGTLDTNLYEKNIKGPSSLRPRHKFDVIYDDTTINQEIKWNGTRWIGTDGFSIAKHRGTTAERPKAVNAQGGGQLYRDTDIGFPYYDTDLKKIFYVGSIGADNASVQWYDAEGVYVNMKDKGTFAEKPISTYFGNAFTYFCTDKAAPETGIMGIPIFYKETVSNVDRWVDALGRRVDDTYPAKYRGAFNDKPTLTASDAGHEYRDTTNNRIIIWTGTAWVDATGTQV